MSKSYNFEKKDWIGKLHEISSCQIELKHCKKQKNKVDKWFGTFVLLFSMPNGKFDEGEIQFRAVDKAAWKTLERKLL